MGFKQLVIIIFLIVVGAIYLILGAVQTSTKFEEFYEQKLEEPKKEQAHYYNIVYVYWVGKEKRALELIESYREKYHKTGLERAEEIDYIEVKIYDEFLNKNQAKGYYKEFMEKYPESDRYEDIKKRYNELVTFY